MTLVKERSLLKHDDNYTVIRAVYDEETITVYQAYSPLIAQEVERLGHFGEHFSLNRMTWIKPSFLWMMYRSDWGRGKGQENVLAIQIKRSEFDTFLHKAIYSSFCPSHWNSREEWKQALQATDVIIQWDPERDIYGNPQNYRSLQMGLRREAIRRYVSEGIISMSNISDQVHDLYERREQGTNIINDLPAERIYPFKFESLRALPSTV